MYFYVIPTFFPKQKTAEELPEGAAPVEPIEPASWLWTLTKFFGTIALLAVAFLLMIYFKQESMLYVPAQPIQFMEDNPENYKDPTKRQLQFEEVKVITKDL